MIHFVDWALALLVLLLDLLLLRNDLNCLFTLKHHRLDSLGWLSSRLIFIFFFLVFEVTLPPFLCLVEFLTSFLELLLLDLVERENVFGNLTIDHH